MTSLYEARLEELKKAPLETGPVPAHGIDNPIVDELCEYYRRVARFESPLQVRLPPSPREISSWFSGALTDADVSRAIEDSSAVFFHLKARRVHVSSTTSACFEAIPLWSLLVERQRVALADDPSIPLLRIFGAGYSLNFVGHGLEIWGELPWTIDPVQVIGRAGVASQSPNGRR